MVALFTDFGPAGPYVGQMTAAVLRDAPGVPVVDLLSAAPGFDPRASAYLLAALVPDFPPGTVFLGVVDPGVGGDRRPVVVRTGGHWFVGPENGLFAIALRRGGDGAAWTIDWRPGRLSASFHGRDLFAPVAARIACGEDPPGTPLDPAAIDRPDWPDDLPAVIHVDGYGNAMTGLRADAVAAETAIEAAGRRMTRAETFSAVGPDTAFWYVNANGLVEIAVNRGSAAEALGLAVGMPVAVGARP